MFKAFYCWVFLVCTSLFADGSVEGILKLTDRHGKASTGADECFVYIFGKGYTEKGEGVGAKIVMKELRFIPRAVAIVAGQSVEFPNRDVITHNVFCPSKQGLHFDLKEYGEGQSGSHTFKKMGNYQIYCNIHPHMIANILVLPNRAFARVGKDGSFKIDKVKVGNWIIGAWSPRAKKVTKLKIEVKEGEATKVELQLQELLSDSSKHRNKHGKRYKTYR